MAGAPNMEGVLTRDGDGSSRSPAATTATTVDPTFPSSALMMAGRAEKRGGAAKRC